MLLTVRYMQVPVCVGLLLGRFERSHEERNCRHGTKVIFKSLWKIRPPFSDIIPRKLLKNDYIVFIGSYSLYFAACTRALILEAGLWFVWRRKTDWDKYERNLDQAITNLEKIRQKLAVSKN